MSDVIFGVVAFAIVIGGLGLGYRRWLQPQASHLSVQGRGLLALAILTLIGGFVGGFFWWLDDVRSFPWDLPPLAGRMLAAAGWSFAIATFICLERPTRRRLRLLLLMLVVYLVPLLIAIPLFHLDRFNFTTFIANAFFVIVFLMTFPALWFLWKQPSIHAADNRDTLANSVVSRWLIGVAIVTGLWGVALFLTDSGPTNLIWVWPGDLLSSRLISVMLLALCTGSLYSMRDGDTARIMLATIMTYGLGVAVATFWNSLAGKPVAFMYFIVFGVMFVVSALLLYRELTPTLVAGSIS